MRHHLIPGKRFPVNHDFLPSSSSARPLEGSFEVFRQEDVSEDGEGDSTTHVLLLQHIDTTATRQNVHDSTAVFLEIVENPVLPGGGNDGVYPGYIEGVLEVVEVGGRVRGVDACNAEWGRVYGVYLVN